MSLCKFCLNEFNEEKDIKCYCGRCMSKINYVDSIILPYMTRKEICEFFNAQYLTVKDLKEFCKYHHVKNFSTMNRKELKKHFKEIVDNDR